MSVSLIPDSAPFNVEQRAWLNGFLAGWLGIAGNESAEAGAAIGSIAGLGVTAPPSSLGAVEGSVADASSQPEDTPWHDPALPIEDRMALAAGKSKANRLMAAMAQFDCGTCGYLCQTYSEAIANGSETALTLCSPGGSATSKMIKKIIKESANGNGSGQVELQPPPAAPTPSTTTEWTRKKPFSAKLLRSINLNGDGSDKATSHVEIELGPDGPTYAVGDSLGIIPTNCGDLASEIRTALDAAGSTPVTTASGVAVTLAEALDLHCCLAEITEEAIQVLADSATDPAEATALRGLIDDDSLVAEDHLLDILRRFPSARPDPARLIAALAELKPRLYSISSSPRRHAGQVHLTVRKVAYLSNERNRKGVASTMPADRVVAGDPVRVFVRKPHGFTIPDDPTTPIIMVGPGTGIAPFRAFLHERDAIGATGKNWLFFGDQKSETDFLYRDELEALQTKGVLTALDTACSRDQSAKIYVQDRLKQHGAEVYAWLEAGAAVFVCGGAKRMAADVDRALREVIQTHAGGPWRKLRVISISWPRPAATAAMFIEWFVAPMKFA